MDHIPVSLTCEHLGTIRKLLMLIIHCHLIMTSIFTYIILDWYLELFSFPFLSLSSFTGDYMEIQIHVILEVARISSM